MKPAYTLAFLTLLLSACGLKPLTAEEIVEKSIEQYGVRALKKAEVSFQFRKYDYFYRKKGKELLYRRSFTEGQEDIIDVFNGKSVERTIDGAQVQLDEKQVRAIQNSLNSVIYFAFLPLQLSDPATNFKTIGVDYIDSTAYFMVQVTFDEAGGGEDHEDVFMYWIDCETFSMDYLAYRYQTNGGGIRFRAAKNKRAINGVMIQDYDNYSPREGVFIPLRSLGKSYQNDELMLLSEIKIENPSIQLL